MTRARGDSSTPLFVGAAVIGVAILLWALRDLVILLGFSLLVAYVLDPVVSTFERVRLPRRWKLSRAGAAAIVILALLTLVAWAASLGVPRLVAEVTRFANRTPATLTLLLEQARAHVEAQGWTGALDPAIENLKANAAPLLQDVAIALGRWIGRLFGGLGQVLGFALLPLLTYYLLAEREAVQRSLFQFLPDSAHERAGTWGGAVDRALRSYVRGLALVCLVTGVTTGLVLGVLGFPVAFLLGVVAALGEVVPYLGFLVTALAIGLTGYSVSPLHAFLGLGLYTVINNAVALLVTPRVMGRHLKMHPFVVTVSILAGAQLLGPAGVMLALPGTAVIQSVIQEFARRRDGNDP